MEHFGSMGDRFEYGVRGDFATKRLHEVLSKVYELLRTIALPGKAAKRYLICS